MVYFQSFPLCNQERFSSLQRLLQEGCQMDHLRMYQECDVRFELIEVVSGFNGIHRQYLPYYKYAEKLLNIFHDNLPSSEYIFTLYRCIIDYEEKCPCKQTFYSI